MFQPAGEPNPKSATRACRGVAVGGDVRDDHLVRQGLLRRPLRVQPLEQLHAVADDGWEVPQEGRGMGGGAGFFLSAGAGGSPPSGVGVPGDRPIHFSPKMAKESRKMQKKKELPPPSAEKEQFRRRGGKP